MLELDVCIFSCEFMCLKKKKKKSKKKIHRLDKSGKYTSVGWYLYLKSPECFFFFCVPSPVSLNARGFYFSLFYKSNSSAAVTSSLRHKSAGILVRIFESTAPYRLIDPSCLARVSAACEVRIRCSLFSAASLRV